MAAVTVKINADGSGFDRTLGTLNRKVHGIAGNMASSLKGAFIGLVGAGSVGALVNSMANFAEEIKQAADRLGITTDRVQQLRKVARDAGKDLSAFDKAFTSLEDAASKGLVKGSKEANVAKQLGLTEDDLRTLNKNDLLKKALEGTKQYDRQKGEALLGELVGAKSAGWLMGSREGILSGEAPLVSNNDIEALFEFKNSLEDLTDVVRAGLIPALTSLVDWVLKTTAGYIDATRTYTDKDKQAEAIYQRKYGQAPNQALSFMDSLHYQTGAAAVTMNPFLSQQEKAKKLKEMQDQHLKWSYGQDVIDELNKTYVPEVKSITDELKTAQDARKKARAEEEARLNGPVNREAPPTTTKQEKAVSLDRELKGGSSWLSMGGLMGVDMGYRMERLSKETVRLLTQMAKDLAILANKDGGEPFTTG